MTPLIGFLITILLTGMCTFSGYDCTSYLGAQIPEGHIEGCKIPDSDCLNRYDHVDVQDLIVPGSYDYNDCQPQALTRLPDAEGCLWLS